MERKRCRATPHSASFRFALGSAPSTSSASATTRTILLHSHDDKYRLSVKQNKHLCSKGEVPLRFLSACLEWRTHARICGGAHRSQACNERKRTRWGPRRRTPSGGWATPGGACRRSRRTRSRRPRWRWRAPPPAPRPPLCRARRPAAPAAGTRWTGSAGSCPAISNRQPHHTRWAPGSLNTNVSRYTTQKKRRRKKRKLAWFWAFSAWTPSTPAATSMARTRRQMTTASTLAMVRAASPPLSLLSSGALCVCLGRLRSEKRGRRVTVQRLKWTVVTCECDERDASGVRSLLLVFFIPPATALCSALVFFTHSASRAVQKASKL